MSVYYWSDNDFRHARGEWCRKEEMNPRTTHRRCEAHRFIIIENNNYEPVETIIFDVRYRATGDNRVDCKKGLSNEHKGYEFWMPGDMLAYFCYEA